MLFAESVGDRATFDRLWAWTRSKLQHRQNALFAWKWDPAHPRNRVSDRNDASDGDILIAWALQRAALRWKSRGYATAARRIIVDIRRRLVVRIGGRLVLLPGTEGFRAKAAPTIVNLSYYIYPAFRAFDREVPSREWRRLRQDGLGLLAEARFGRWGLPPDWLALDAKGGVALPRQFAPRFGFDAIRIPLYLVWGDAARPARLASFLDFWNSFGPRPIPAWVDLKNNTVAPYPASSGFAAVIRLTRAAYYGASERERLPTIGKTDDYYSASLTLLSALAYREGGLPAAGLSRQKMPR